MLKASRLAELLHMETSTLSAQTLGEVSVGEKLVHISALIALQKAVLAVGWIEHTNDWDWFWDVWAPGGPDDMGNGERGWHECYSTPSLCDPEKKLLFAFEGEKLEAPNPEWGVIDLWIENGGFANPDPNPEPTHLWVERAGREEEEPAPEYIPISAITRIEIREEH